MPVPTPEIRFSKLVAGRNRYCGITAEAGHLVCVQAGKAIIDRPGPYVDLSLSENTAPWSLLCAIHKGGHLECEGSGSDLAPKGNFTKVVVGFFNACALSTNGEATCWMPEATGGVRIPAGNYVDLSGNMNVACVLTQAFHTSCFGSGSAAPPDPPGHYIHIASAPNLNCGVGYGPDVPSQPIFCWGPKGVDQKPLAGTFTSLAINDDGAGCAVHETGGIQCWGQRDFAPPPDIVGPFSSVSLSSDQTCALRTDGRAICWPSRLR